MKNFLKASNWNGGEWLILLCILQVTLIVIYIAAHTGKSGHEYIQLDKKQAAVVNSLLMMYTDKEEPTRILALDTSKKDLYIKYTQIRIARTNEIVRFLDTEYDSDIAPQTREQVITSLNQFNSKDAGLYLSSLKIKVKSYFWLSGGKAYYETILWCLLGVFTSLIFYVGLKVTPCDPEEAFDINEISNQVAKMFYAPISTLVLVIGYHFLWGNDANMIDVTVNKGVILFSFLSGFYSGRVMKLLDKIKELILPVSKIDAPQPVKEIKKTHINVQLSLAETLARSADGADITEAGFNAAEVILTPEAGGDPIVLDQPREDQDDTFTGDNIKFGKYMLTATYSYKIPGGGAIINLEQEQAITINENEQVVTIILEKADHEG